MRQRYTRLRISGLIALAALALVGACSSQSDQLRAAQARDKLRAALNTPVHTREERDDQSRLMVDAVEHAELERMTQSDVQAALGMGNTCQVSDLCSKQGFRGDDMYYVIGQAADDKIKQMPTLIVGFDPHGHVKRVFTLRTH
jgi:hypothetical protein